MASINHVVITGNLTRDPEVRQTKGGTTVCTLRVAVNERFKSGDEWQDRANFFDVTVWGTQGENCEKYLAKGSKVAVDGRLHWSEWEADGGKRQKVDITANPGGVVFLDSKRDSDGAADSDVPADTTGLGSSGGHDDDIPF